MFIKNSVQLVWNHTHKVWFTTLPRSVCKLVAPTLARAHYVGYAGALDSIAVI